MADSNTNTTNPNVYQLFLYADKVGSSDEGFKIDTSYNWVVGEKNYDAKLTKLSYTKHVYAPCEISAQIDVSVKSSPSTNDGTAMPDNKKLVESFLNKKVDLKINSSLIATNYFVYKVKPIYKTIASSLVSVELTIFSADKLMTLDKYSRAYTARKLYSDILAEESKKFNLKDSANTSLSTLVANHMQLLKYKKSETKDGTTTDWTERDELRIPYVVQYNESFYQFMVRTANRFGEFLYFEDGKLNLGMQPSDINYYKRDSKGDIVQNDKNENVIIDWATEPNAVQSRYYESVLPEAISVEDRAYSYKTHTPDSDGAYASSADSRYNIDPVSSDEWTKQKLEENEYVPYLEAVEEELKVYVADIVFKGLESTTLGEAITSVALGLIKAIYDCHRSNKDYNNLMDEANYKVEDVFLIQEDQRDGSSYTQFATYGGSDNLKNNLNKLLGKGGITNFIDLFYSLIRKKEKEIGEQAVNLDFGNHYKPIKLGDKLRVDGIDYVTISVEGSYKDNEESLKVSAIPVMTLDASSTNSIPKDKDVWSNVVPFPPAVSDVIIRDARPQVAFVAETMDPENMGRIRVRYPWQDKNGDPSPWIRVTLPLATTGGAVNFTPCVGDEVMVGYEHGNIDRPYATGYLVAPFVNEKWKNALPLDQYGGLHGIKVKTGHHLLFTDGANAATLLASTFGPLACLKSLWPTGAWGAWPHGNETTADFGGGFELSDRYGFYKITGSTDDRAITIESPAGTVEINAFQGISISAPNGDIEIKGKNVSIEASNRLSINSGENIKEKLWYKKEWPEIKSSMLIGKTFDDCVSTLKSKVLDEVLDISFLRCVVEWFIRPVNGTLSIKSYTFVTIEAGEGTTEFPQSSLRYGKGANDNLEDLDRAINTVKFIRPNVCSLIDRIRMDYEALCMVTGAFNAITSDKGYNNNECIISYDKIVNKGDTRFIETDPDFNWDSSDLKYEDVTKPYTEEEPQWGDFEDYGEELQQVAYDAAYDTWYETKKLYEENTKKNFYSKKHRTAMVRLANQIRIAANELASTVSRLQNLKDDDFILNTAIFAVNKDDIDVSDVVKLIKALTFPTDKGFISLDEMKKRTYKASSIVRLEYGVWMNLKNACARYVVYKYLSSRSYLEHDSDISSISDAYDNKKWVEFVDSIDKGTWIDSFGKSWFNENLNPLNGFVDDQLQWSHGFKGKILMSDEASMTASFDDSLQLKPHYNRSNYEEDLDKFRYNLKKI
jgi:hypothetical protein